MRKGRALRSSMLLAGGFPFLFGACAKPPDLDAMPESAGSLELQRAHQDSLDCRGNDCSDWFRIEIPEKGTLALDLRCTGESKRSAQLSVTLADASGASLAVETSGDRSRARIDLEVVSQIYLVAVQAPHRSALAPYEIVARFEPAPPPPPPPAPLPPPVQTHTSAVLEVEGWGQDSQALLIESGSAQGLQPGLRGRIVAGGQVIGAVVIEEVFLEGSRARIEGPTSQPIGTTAVVEFDLPVSEPLPGEIPR